MGNLRILVVDDDRDFADSLAEALRLEGHQVDVALSGERAVERFRQCDYDLTFMDVKLPGRNGVERLLELRALRPAARVVLVTGFDMQRLTDDAVAHGAYGVLQKPLDMNCLREMLGKIDLAGQ
jgi:CheY-like chemotaxis protein